MTLVEILGLTGIGIISLSGIIVPLIVKKWFPSFLSEVIKSQTVSTNVKVEQEKVYHKVDWNIMKQCPEFRSLCKEHTCLAFIDDRKKSGKVLCNALEVEFINYKDES